MRPKDEYIAAVFWEAIGSGSDKSTDHQLMALFSLRDRARELQQAAENPARTTCKTCGGMMVNPRPCRADNCGFRK